MSILRDDEPDWVSVLEHAGRLKTRSTKLARGKYICENPVYARSLSRAYLADIRPRRAVMAP